MSESFGESLDKFRQKGLRSTKAQVLALARNMNVRGRSNKTKSELVELIIKKFIRNRGGL